MKIELFYTPGCAKCTGSISTLKAAAEAVHGVEWCEVNVLDDLDRAVKLGVLTLPALVVGGSPLFGAAILTSFAVGRAIPLALAAVALEWIEQLNPLARFRRSFEMTGSLLLIVTGLYLLNGYVAFFPWLTW